MADFLFGMIGKLIIITILLVVLSYLTFSNVPKVIASFEDFLGIDKKATEEANEIEKYIVCAYKTCTEGINNNFCSEAGLTPYDPKIDDVFKLLDMHPPIKICDPYAFTGQFPIILHVKKGTEIRKDIIKSLSDNKIKCINSERVNPELFIDEFYTDLLFSVTPDTSEECKSDSDYTTAASKLEAKKNTILYLWVKQTLWGETIVRLEPYAHFLNLTDSPHEGEVFECMPAPSLHRIHYNGKDYFMYFCPKYTEGGRCVYVKDASNDYAYDVKICSLDANSCEEVDLKRGEWYEYGNNIKIMYNGIKNDYGLCEYMSFTVKAA